MSYSLIRSKMKELLLEVTGAEIVFEYPPHVTDWDTFISQFVDSTGKVFGFEISRESAQAAYDNTDEGTDTHAIVVRGYRSVLEGAVSYNEFQDTVDAVRAKFRFDYYLDGLTGLQIIQTTPMQARRIDERMFGDVLCHYVELTVNVTELVTT